MKEVGKQTDSGIKLSVIGIHGAGKTTLAVGLYGRAKERGDYCEPINRDSIDYLKRMSNVLNDGRIPPTKGGRHPIELMYHCGDSETRLDFFDYMGEDSSHKQSLDGLIKRDDCGGVVILVNPQHFESSQKREENETLIRNAAESIKSAKNIRYRNRL